MKISGFHDVRVFPKKEGEQLDFDVSTENHISPEKKQKPIGFLEVWVRERFPSIRKIMIQMEPIFTFYLLKLEMLLWLSNLSLFFSIFRPVFLIFYPNNIQNILKISGISTTKFL